MPLVAALALALFVGFPVALLLARSHGWPVVLGLTPLLGLALVALMLLILSVVGAPWSLAILFPLTAVLSGVGLVAALRRGLPPAAPFAFDRPGLLALGIDAVTCALAAGHAVFATLVPLVEQDFLVIWGLKGRMFYEAAGVDWEFLSRSRDIFSHPDYPVLLPLMLDWVALFFGRWEDRLIGLLWTLFGVCILLVMRGMLARETRSRPLRALATLALAPAALSPWIGLADGPLIAYAMAGLLFLRAAVDLNDPRLIRVGALLLGCAALVKNEGAAFLTTAALALVIAVPRGWRLALRLWPALALIIPWWTLRTWYGLRNDIVTSSSFTALSSSTAENFVRVVMEITAYSVGKPFFWIGVALALAMGVRQIERERLILLVVVLQLLSYLVVYAITPNDLAWQVRWSWERLLSHLTLPLAFVAAVFLVRMAARSPATNETLDAKGGQ